MAHGIEARSPSLDWRLVCYAMYLPSASKTNYVNNKWVAREAMRGLMPESIRSAKLKVGLNSLLPKWLPGPLREWALHLLRPQRGDGHPLIKIAALRVSCGTRTAVGNLTWNEAAQFWPYLHALWFERHFLKQ